MHSGVLTGCGRSSQGISVSRLRRNPYDLARLHLMWLVRLADLQNACPLEHVQDLLGVVAHMERRAFAGLEYDDEDLGRLGRRGPSRGRSRASTSGRESSGLC
jgi:hypothetical protein